jgi:solute carrier family 35 protein
MMSCVVQALYLIACKRVDTIGESEWDLLRYSSLLSLPFVVFAAVHTSQLSSAMAFASWDSIGFWLSFVGSILIGVTLNYSVFLCSRLTSALTTR